MRSRAWRLRPWPTRQRRDTCQGCDGQQWPESTRRSWVTEIQLHVRNDLLQSIPSPCSRHNLVAWGLGRLGRFRRIARAETAHIVMASVAGSCLSVSPIRRWEIDLGVAQFMGWSLGEWREQARKQMKSNSFSIARVDRLRRAAERARELSDKHRGPSAEGWFASAYDANDLVRVFDTLRLKAGFALHAYEFKEGMDGNGIIWAVPAEPSLVAPAECPDLAVMWLDPPQPPGAVPLMQAIEGDGSPWSYLSASILRREAEEFGAPGMAASGVPRGSCPCLHGRLMVRMYRFMMRIGPARRPPATGSGTALFRRLGNRPMSNGTRPRESSCTSTIPLVKSRFTGPQTRIGLTAMTARPEPGSVHG